MSYSILYDMALARCRDGNAKTVPEALLALTRSEDPFVKSLVADAMRQPDGAPRQHVVRKQAQPNAELQKIIDGATEALRSGRAKTTEEACALYASSNPQAYTHYVQSVLNQRPSWRL